MTLTARTRRGTPYTLGHAARTPTARSRHCWHALLQHMGGPAALREHDGGTEQASPWSCGQTLLAALDRARLTGNYQAFDTLSNNLARYTYGSASGNRYHDDSSWIGLAYMQAWQQTRVAVWLQRAQSVFELVRCGGGYAQGSAGELAAMLYLAGQRQQDAYLQYALHVDGTLDLSVRQTDEPNPCNHGVHIGLKTLLYLATGTPNYLRQAQQRARTSMAWLRQEDRFWQASPALNAIYFRNLMQLNSVSPQPLYRQSLQAYANRAWMQGLNPVTGLFDRGGIGHYGHLPAGSQATVIDQAGLVQIYSLLAMSRQQAAELA